MCLTESQMYQRLLEIFKPVAYRFKDGVAGVFLSSQNLLFCPNILGCIAIPYCRSVYQGAY